MKVDSRIGLCLGALLLLSSVANAQEFSLGFSGPAAVQGSAGSVVSVDYECVLAPGDGLEGDGAQGWSISVSSDEDIVITLT